jgi:ketosteroid isomerase-like protein
MLVAIALLAAALTGCGPLGGESDKEAAGDAVTELVQARNEGDFATVCDLLAADRLERFRRAGVNCEKTLRRVFGHGTTTTIRIEQVRVSGDRATVDATVSQTGGAGNAQTILLLKENGDWKVSQVGF